jgi:hypothetical protein
MNTALRILLVLGALGALDTFYYHEWKLRLPETPGARRELRLHASRDFAYAIVFGSLAWTTWNGGLIWPFAAILLFEIVVTLTDFIEEDRTRKLPAGERVMHAVMGITYGIFLALFFPHALTWERLATGFGPADYGVLSWVLTLFAAGVLISGIRDLAASRRLASGDDAAELTDLLPNPPGLFQVTALVGRGLDERHPQTHLEERRDGGSHLYPRQVESSRPLDLQQKHALHVQKGGQHCRDGLFMHRHETARRPYLPADRRLSHPHDPAIEPTIAERPGPFQTTSLRVVNCPLDRLDFPVPDHGQMLQTFFDGPFPRRWAPVELRLSQPLGQLPGLALSFLECLAALL